MTKQPSLFISHGTIYEAFKSEQLKQDFQKLRAEHFKILPEAIVIFSEHWQTETIEISTSLEMHQMDEGFPPEFQSSYSIAGNPDLANRMIKMLHDNGISAKENPYRQLDHGALIPLLLLFSNDKIPVIQLSQQYQLDPAYHAKVAEILKELRSENILFIGSGGLVHNRNEIHKFGGHEIAPDNWAKEFDEYITKILSESQDNKKLIEAYNHPFFKKSHPTSEHYLPIVFASSLAEKSTKIYESFQWKNLSMSAFRFD